MQVTVSQISQSSIFLSRASTADFPEVSSDWRLAQLHLYKDCLLPSETGGREEKRRKKIYTCLHTPVKSSFTRDRKRAKLLHLDFCLGNCRRSFTCLTTLPLNHKKYSGLQPHWARFSCSVESHRSLIWSRRITIVASWMALLRANREDKTSTYKVNATTYKGRLCVGGQLMPGFAVCIYVSS